jgi:hypothetical protein
MTDAINDAVVQTLDSEGSLEKGMEHHHGWQ